MHEQHQTLSTRIPYLEEEVEKTQQACAKEKQKMQRATEHKVREANIAYEALCMTKEGEKLKAQKKEDLLEKQSLLHKSILDQMAVEKKEPTMKMEKVISKRETLGTV